ncbi:MAG: hypothetical protein E6Q76_08230 [Rhizobium sp.]|nr:MAG: hypothetical protein E6Q76_08230 [Rhizobium sp.]
MWVGNSRTNYFRVKDASAFRAAMEPLEVEVVESGDKLGLLSSTDDGGFPTFNSSAEDGQEEIDLPGLVASHLAEGEVAVFQSVGFDKSRYLTGYSSAVNHLGEEVAVNLDDIYKRAADTFKVPVESISTATY